MKNIFNSVFLVFTILYLGIFPSMLLAENPDAAISPITVFGDIPEPVQKIINNRFSTLLGKHYRLVSEAQYLKAKEAIFNELDIEQCTESYCIQKIQELLQVERLFFLTLASVDSFTQITITLIREEDKLLQEDSCENCDLKEIYEKIKGLVSNIVKSDIGETIVQNNSEDSKQWESIQYSKEVNDFNEFIEQFPTSRFVYMATDIINQLDEEKWLTVQNINTEAGYDDYLSLL